MASGNDPANIPYIIAENGFYYVAYKEKVKVPEIVVSSKGVANGLSEEYNDGWDFGPDSYDPTSTANPPYTQTSGIQEAMNYAKNNNNAIELTSGAFNIYNTILIDSPGIIIHGQGETGKNQPGTQIVVQSSGIDAIDIDVSSGDVSNIQIYGFRIVFTTSTTGHGINVINGNSNGASLNVSIFHNISVHNVDASHYAYNLPYFLFCEFNFLNAYNCGGFINIGSSSNTVADTSGNSVFIECKDGIPNSPTVPILNINGGVSAGTQLLQFLRLEISGQLNGQPAISVSNADRLNFLTAILEDDDTSGTYIGIETNNVQNTEFSNLGFNSAGEGAQINISNSSFITFRNVTPIDSTSPITTLSTTSSNYIFYHGNVGAITFSGTGIFIKDSNFYSSTDGTTAGTVSQYMPEVSSVYKKSIFVFNGYENDTTTNQTIDFPIAFSTIAGITANTTGLTISATTSGITITSPDSTSTYNGVVIVEGY